MPSWKKVVISGSSPTFNNVTTSGNVSGSSTSVATFGSYGGNVSGSSISTGSFGLILGDGSAITGIAASSIFAQTGSYYSAYSDLQVTGSLSVLGNISGSFSGLGIGQKYKHSQAVAATTWTVSHNFDYQYVNVDVYDGNDQMVIPTTLTATDSNTITLTFSSPVSGNAIVSTGGQAIDERGKNVVHNQSTPSANWRVTHSIGDQYPSVTVYDSDDNVIIPQQINAADGSKMDIVFSEAVSGNANISVGGGIVTGTMTGSAQVVESLPSGTVSGSAQIATDISGSFTAASSSFSTRVTTEEGNVDTLQSTMTSEQTNIDNLQTDSGSFSTRVTGLKTDSGSFSTRVTTEEGNVDTLQSTMTSEQTNIDNLQTDSGSFSSRTTTVEGTGTIQGVGTTNAVTFATVDTGQGANELYDMDQNVKTDSAVTFATVNTGQGANELYDMDQNVLTTSSPTFADLTATGTVTAQEFHTEFVSSSILYTSGSTRFGNSSDDIHQFTGSIHLIDSGSVSGSVFSTGSFGRVEASTVTGTLATAAQANVTSVGTLSTLTVGGVIRGANGSASTPEFTFTNNGQNWGDSPPSSGDEIEFTISEATTNIFSVSVSSDILTISTTFKLPSALISPAKNSS